MLDIRHRWMSWSPLQGRSRSFPVDSGKSAQSADFSGSRLRDLSGKLRRLHDVEEGAVGVDQEAAVDSSPGATVDGHDLGDLEPSQDVEDPVEVTDVDENGARAHVPSSFGNGSPPTALMILLFSSPRPGRLALHQVSLDGILDDGAVSRVIAHFTPETASTPPAPEAPATPAVPPRPAPPAFESVSGG